MVGLASEARSTTRAFPASLVGYARLPTAKYDPASGRTSIIACPAAG
jgi:hypothetical protein